MCRLALGLLLSAAAVSGTAVCSRPESTVAELFTIEDHGSYRIVHSSQCSPPESYVLYPRHTSAPDLGADYKYFGVPLQNVVVTQTVPIAFIETVGARSAIRATSEYTTAPCVAKQIQEEVTEVYSSGNDYSGDAYDAIFTDPWSLENWGDAATADKLICAADSYETDPLGSAEWLKFYGAFFDSLAVGASAFCATSSRYACNSLAASSISKQSLAYSAPYKYQVPMVLFASKGWSGDHKIEMPPYKNKFIKDAGGNYPDLTAYAEFESVHWLSGEFNGFSFPPENNASFHEVLALADVIIDGTYPSLQTLDTIKTLYSLDGVAQLPKAFVTGRVYTLDGTMSSNSPYGGTDWFESRVAEPDVMLADLISVFQAVDGEYNPAGLTFLRHAQDGTTRVPTAADCPDVTAARPVVAPTCSDLASDDSAIFSWLGAFAEIAEPSYNPCGVAPPAPPAGLLCTDSCPATARGYSRTSNGNCNDGGPGSENAVCGLGTDCTDCGPRFASPSPPPGILCEDNCIGVRQSDGSSFSRASNTKCNDGGPGSENAVCDLGTDCTDCGPRFVAPAPPPLA